MLLRLEEPESYSYEQHTKRGACLPEQMLDTKQAKSIHSLYQFTCREPPDCNHPWNQRDGGPEEVHERLGRIAAAHQPHRLRVAGQILEAGHRTQLHLGAAAGQQRHQR